MELALHPPRLDHLVELSSVKRLASALANRRAGLATATIATIAWKQHVSLYPVPPAGDSDLDADLAPYAGAKGTLKLPYPHVDYALIERVVRRLIETRSSK